MHEGFEKDENKDKNMGIVSCLYFNTSLRESKHLLAKTEGRRARKFLLIRPGSPQAALCIVPNDSPFLDSFSCSC